jgi:hypothetical protein
MKNMTVLFVGLIAMAAWVLSRGSVDASVSDASAQLYADARLSAVEIKRESIDSDSSDYQEKN